MNEASPKNTPPLFDNPQVDLLDLPEVDQLNFHALEPAYLKVSYISITIFFLFLLIPMGWVYFGSDIILELPYLILILLVGWLILFLFSLWLARKNYRIKAYALRDHDIIYKSGVVFFKLTTVPFNRVQHCEIKQGPIQRWFGLNTLQIFTAGGATSDLVIDGLNPERAKRLKEFIINKTALAEDGAED